MYMFGEGVIPNTALSWHLEHKHFAQLLDFLEGELCVLSNGNWPNYELIREVTYYICHFGARYHHAREDIAFGYIMQSNPSMSGAISRLVQEHANIAAVGEELDALLATAVAGDVMASTCIERVLASFLTDYRNHITTEEQSIVPYAEEALSAAEWGSVASAAPRGPDSFQAYSASRHSPKFGSEAHARYLNLCERIRVGRSAPQVAPSFHRTEYHWEHQAGVEKGSAGIAAAPHRPILVHREHQAGVEKGSAGIVAAPHNAIMVSRVATARGRLLRQTIALLALILAYLQYYYFDIGLQIVSLPSNIFEALQ